MLPARGRLPGLTLFIEPGPVIAPTSGIDDGQPHNGLGCWQILQLGLGLGGQPHRGLGFPQTLHPEAKPSVFLTLRPAI